MAKKNNGLVVLSNPEIGEQSFELSHAERILDWDQKKNKVNWTLHDSKLTFENGKINSGASSNDI